MWCSVDWVRCRNRSRKAAIPKSGAVFENWHLRGLYNIFRIFAGDIYIVTEWKWITGGTVRRIERGAVPHGNLVRVVAGESKQQLRQDGDEQREDL